MIALVEAPRLIHATGIILRDRGVIILGSSGAGKTTLALRLIEGARTTGMLGRLVADDQLRVETCGGRVVCTAPRAIAGLVEVVGLGPRPVAYEDQAVMDLVVRLVGAREAPRFRDETFETIGDVSLPCLHLPERSAGRNALAIAAWFA